MNAFRLLLTFCLLLNLTARSAETIVVNRVRAVVAGKVITQRDLERRMGNIYRLIRDADGKQVQDLEQILTEMINEALFVHSIKIHERFKVLAERPGRGEELLSQEVASKHKNKREVMVAKLRMEGKTLEQRKAELLDEELLDIAQSLVTDSVQVSPSAVEQYLKDHPEEAGKGEAVKAHWVRIALSTKEMTKAKAKALAVGVQSVADMENLAEQYKEEDKGSLGWIYANKYHPLPSGVSRDSANELLSFGDADGPTNGFWDDKEYFYIVYIEEYEKDRQVPGDELRRRAERRLLDRLQTQALEKSILRLRKQISWRRIDE
ncbi:MAG: hypothetical protein HOK62_11175 [Verrucomicrobiales bacterium]|nr:hypothetical protein [Verrucomicrobiales bacterium]MBT6451262.1 hypothetical protein [Verrucomicrobiales bacterium]